MRYMRQITPKMYHRPWLAFVCWTSGMVVFLLGCSCRHFAGLYLRCKPNWSMTKHVAARCANLSHGHEAPRKHARDMHGLPAGAVLDLVTTGGAVRNQNRVIRGFPHCWQQRQLTHRE